MSKKRTVALLVAGVMIGLMFTPLPAQAALTINKIWKGIMPKADARYVQQRATAYAYVVAPAAYGGPRLDAPRTRNFTGVTSPGVGIYCLAGAASVDLATHPAVMSVEWTGSTAGWSMQAYPSLGGLSCTPGQLQVITVANGAASSNVSFTVWVP